jgi:asparagine synthase (glutamine-hydrolysing)
VHLYAIAAGIPAISEQLLAERLAGFGREFSLDAASAWSVRSSRGGLVAAGMHHGPDRAGRRRYLAREHSTLTWFDGLPVETAGRFAGTDAAALAAHWEDLGETLEGQFNAVRLDLRDERAELLLDTLGLVPIFKASCGGGVLVSNSATLIAQLLELGSPDPLGVSTFMGLGWAAGGRTLTRGVEALGGGALHTLRGGELRAVQRFGPHTIPAAGRERVATAEIVSRLTALTRRAIEGAERVSCAITGGHDTRVLIGLLQAIGENACCYYTDGRPGDIDVAIACELAERLGLAHVVVSHDLSGADTDWVQAAARFVLQNDGRSSLLQLSDYVDLADEHPPLGVKLWGVGGEIGRSGTGGLISIATNTPFVRSSRAAQRRLLAMKVRDEAGLMTAEARHEVDAYVQRFAAERLAEGWRAAELQEAFYVFERLGRWGATGPRRTAGTDDLFSPFCSRAFIDYCFSLDTRERFVGASHHRILSELSPLLRDHRYDIPSRPQRPWLAPALAGAELANVLVGRLGLRSPSSAGADAGEAQAHPVYRFPHEWFEGRLGLLRELLSTPDSELWSYISRERLRALLEGEEAERARHQEGLLRAATLCWYFHGPAPDTRLPFADEHDRRNGAAAPGSAGDLLGARGMSSSSSG